MKVTETATEDEVFKGFKLPLKYDKEVYHIVDADNNPVIAMRGWSVLGKKGIQLEKAAAIQDKLAEMMILAFNEKYYKPKPNSPWKQKDKKSG